MLPYDPKQRYFGPQGSDLCYLIPPAPPGVPQLAGVFNKAAYTHDVGYSGKPCPWWKQWFIRRAIDKKFLEDLHQGIITAYTMGELSEFQADIAEAYAEAAYKAVRLGGWSFFRKESERLY